MSDRIQLLSDALANQIAAGEVVQRPASVVKELMENAMDADSSCITLVIKDAGKTLIQVIDDGIGMTEKDARMCFERHATSKLKSTEDLFAIRTMGFRGEAMASIAAVAKVEMKTKAQDDEIGTRIIIEASEVKTQDQIAHEKGTSTSVKSLFYNVPARRNFLKSDPVETRHITDEFIRVALSRPDIEMHFINNDLEVFNLSPGNLAKRIVQLFGNNHKEQLAKCEEETPYIKISGYIGKPEFARKTRGEQFFFVNGRFIKHHYFNHAVMDAYSSMLPTDHYPFYVLMMEIDPKHVDINIHPTKTEVKFDDERTIYGLLKAVVKQSLGLHNFSGSIDFSRRPEFQSKTERLDNLSTFSSFNPSPSKGGNSSFRSEPISNRQQENLKNWESLFPSENMATQTDAIDDQPQEIKIQSSINQFVPNEDDNNVQADSKKGFQLHNRYIITQVKKGLIIIDQQSAHERILYEKYIKTLSNEFGASQQFLFPQTIELNPSDFVLLKEIEKEIQMLGFAINVFGNNSIIVNGIPAEIKKGDEKALVEGLLEQYKKNKAELKLSQQENLSRALAKKSAIRRGVILTQEEMLNLISQLFACENPNNAPGGEPTYEILSLDKLELMFK